MKFYTHQVEQVCGSGKRPEQQGVKDVKRDHIIAGKLFKKSLPGHTGKTSRFLEKELFLFRKGMFLSSGPAAREIIFQIPEKEFSQKENPVSFGNGFFSGFLVFSPDCRHPVYQKLVNLGFHPSTPRFLP